MFTVQMQRSPRSQPAARRQRVQPCVPARSPHCRGGVSSMLRVSIGRTALPTSGFGAFDDPAIAQQVERQLQRDTVHTHERWTSATPQPRVSPHGTGAPLWRDAFAATVKEVAP